MQLVSSRCRIHNFFPSKVHSPVSESLWKISRSTGMISLGKSMMLLGDMHVISLATKMLLRHIYVMSSVSKERNKMYQR